MARPRKNPMQPATVDRLLRAAGAAFARFGFGGARLEDIASGVGITRPSLLYHFGSKAALYDEVVKRAFTTLSAEVDAAAQSDGTFAELLDQLVLAYIGYLKANPQLAAVLLRAMLEGDPKNTGLLVEEIVPLLTRVEELLTKKGKGVLAPDFPVRAAILQITTAALIQCSAGQIRALVWGASDQTPDLARALFLGSSKPRQEDQDDRDAHDLPPRRAETRTKETNDGIQDNRRQ